MDFCYTCGSKTDPDWVFCRSCGNGLEETDGTVASVPVIVPSDSDAPKVELISRGWSDVVDIDTVEYPTELADDNDIAVPLPAGGIEITVDSITVVEEVAAEPVATDPWDHLRPHGELPPLQDRTTTAARVSQIALLLVAFGALAAAALRFYLNTKIDAFGNGNATARSVDDVRLVANVGLLVFAGLAAVAIAILVWWFVTVRPNANFQPGPAGVAALVGTITGIALVATFYFIEQATVAEALAANSLIVLGLGLLIAACLAAVRTVGRIDLREPV